MQYLLTISIGPVQDFIAAARKTRDLWFGSQMLCELSRAAAQSLKDAGAQLIFPPNSCVSDPDSAVANKILVLVDADDPKELAVNARQAVRSKLDDYKQNALPKIKLPADRQALIDRQIESFLEFYSAWWPCSNENEYPKARTEVERLLAGRKALRDFRASDGVAGIPKSSLDAGREAVVEARSLKPNERRQFGIKTGEALDAISLIKRLAEPRRFVSVSRVAADPVVRKLQQNDLDELAQIAGRLGDTDLVNTFKAQDFPQYAAFAYDTQLFFGDASTEDGLTDAERKDAAQFHQLVREKCHGDPSPYFAVLAADGDRMGAAINDLVKVADHIELSERLAGFATAARQVVESGFHGAIIYSGGDDVLAFLPLDQALACAAKLQEEFAQRVTAFAERKKLDHLPSLSCGVSIAHFGENLQNLLRWAREAEHDAKQSGRNRLAVHLHTRTAGEDFVRSVNPWEVQGPTGKLEPVLDRWQRWLGRYNDKSIPTGAAYHLKSLADEFTYDKADVQALDAEIRRVLGRKRVNSGSQALAQQTIDDLAALASGGADNLRAVVNELLIAGKLT